MKLICNETRILLTEKCNYRCIFCHNEGNDKSQHRNSNADTLKCAINAVIKNGCHDITFTGGEPLLKKELLLDSIRYIRSVDFKLPITIVTNASLLTDELLDKITEQRNVCFNISFHAVNDEEYSRLTGQMFFTLTQLGKRLETLRQRNIPFKMNAVVLQSTLSTPQSVAEMIDFVKQHGAISCKLIELLLVKENVFLINDYLAIESVAKILPKEFRHINDTSRGRIFRDDTGFQLELRKCRCHYGCEQCLQNPRTASLDGQGAYWTCFAKTDMKENINAENYGDVIKNGEKILADMRKQFGQHSPSLNRQLEMTDESRQVWFQVESQDAVQDILQASRQISERLFQDIFFKPISPVTEKEYPTVAIYTVKSDPENSLLIEVVISQQKQNCLPVHCFNYPNTKPVKGSIENLRQILAGRNLEESHTIEAAEEQYLYGEARFVIQKIDNEKVFLFVCVHNEAGENLAKELATRNKLTLLDSYPLQSSAGQSSENVTNS